MGRTRRTAQSRNTETWRLMPLRQKGQVSISFAQSRQSPRCRQGSKRVSAALLKHTCTHTMPLGHSPQWQILHGFKEEACTGMRTDQRQRPVASHFLGSPLVPAMPFCPPLSARPGNEWPVGNRRKEQIGRQSTRKPAWFPPPPLARAGSY